MSQFVPPTITPPARPLGILGSLRAARQNALAILPAIAFTQPIVTGKTGPARWHMIQGPEAMKQVFLDKADIYPKSEVMLRMLRPAVGNSLFTSEGADWRWQRRAIAPVFAARNVNALAPVMTATAQRAADRIAASDGSFEAVSHMLSATFDVICDVALSGREHFDSDAYGAAITRYFLTVGRASLLDFLEVPGWVPRPAELLGAGSVRTMHKMVTAAIDARRAQASEQDDLLDHMMAAKDPETGRQMTPKDLLHNMQFFIVAGHETTALALSWSLYLLANAPEIQDAARRQVTSVIGEKTATAQDLSAIPKVGAIIDEAMRLYPPVGLLARTAGAPDQIYDRQVHAGDTVFLNIYSLHRHQMYWSDPDAFVPTRFEPGTAPDRDKYLHLPFGAGPRICVGANFAVMQAQIILATLLGRFRFSFAGQHPKPVMTMTVRPDPGVTLVAVDLHTAT